MPVESFVADERAMLETMLDVQREELRRLLSEVDDTQARARLVPSLTTLLGLVKHATFVEQVWFHSRVAGVPCRNRGGSDVRPRSGRAVTSELVTCADDQDDGRDGTRANEQTGQGVPADRADHDIPPCSGWELVRT